MNDLGLSLEVVYGHVNHCVTLVSVANWQPTGRLMVQADRRAAFIV